MSDPISEMTPEELEDACCKVLNYTKVDWKECILALRQAAITGLIIEKLQEWKVIFRWSPNAPAWMIIHADFCNIHCQEESLQIAFLRTAQALGHYKIKPPVRELSLEERVCQLEGQMKNLLPDLQ